MKSIYRLFLPVAWSGIKDLKHLSEEAKKHEKSINIQNTMRCYPSVHQSDWQFGFELGDSSVSTCQWLIDLLRGDEVEEMAPLLWSLYIGRVGTECHLTNTGKATSAVVASGFTGWQTAKVKVCAIVYMIKCTEITKTNKHTIPTLSMMAGLRSTSPGGHSQKLQIVSDVVSN